MKYFTVNRFVFIFLTAIFSISISNAQGVLREVSLSDKIKASDLLLEGKVTNKHSFWDANKQHIYTSNTIEIYKIFKGKRTPSTIEIITMGGVVDLQAEKVSPSLQLQKEDVGVFFLKNSDVKLNEVKKGNKSFAPSVGAQSFYAYDLLEGKASGIFQEYEDVSTTLYNEIIHITNTSYKELKSFQVKKKKKTSLKSKVAVVVNSFSPASISAGTKSVLTINGSDFGDVKGSVKFRNADNGNFFGTTALESEILSWTDTKITVEVPDVAGTGKIQVVANGGAASNSSNNLIVTFAEINVQNDVNSVTRAFKVQHVDAHDNGGYIWQMYTEFDQNTDAKASFIRAINSWRCNSKIFWEIGETSTIDVIALDGTNIIRFDNGDELPDGTAGRCTSYYSGCYISGGTDIAWNIAELDIVFDNYDGSGVNGTNWEYGPALPSNNEYDFESVAVHELGHGHQLGHVIDTGDFMHRSLTNGSSMRVPNDNNLAAAKDVQSRSVVFQQCGESPMRNFDCSSLGVEENLLAAKVRLFPSYIDEKKEIFISNAGLLALKEIRFFDVRGLLVKKENLQNIPVQKINLERLHTGMYFVLIHSENGIFSKKIIIR